MKNVLVVVTRSLRTCHMQREWTREYFNIRIDPSAPSGSTRLLIKMVNGGKCRVYPLI